jgi:hypothetical protein
MNNNTHVPESASGGCLCGVVSYEINIKDGSKRPAARLDEKARNTARP